MPEKIGRYILGETLGTGSHGTVWKAEDSLLGRTVALKLLKEDTSDIERSLREARALAQLNHANIVTLYEVEEHGSEAHLVMEYIEGLPLGEYLAQKGISTDQKLSLAKQLLDALKVAHAHGIVHADIKPANIIVRPDGCPVLLDFGLAKMESAATEMDTVTGEGLLNTVVQGTLAYMAPEVMRGDEADEKSDIFSLGAVFYEMFFSKRAFKAPSDAETIHLVLNVDPQAETESADTPTWVRRLVLKMLAKKREERADSFEDLLEAFANPEKQAASTQKKRGKKRLLLGGALAAMLAIAYVGTTQYQWHSMSVSSRINTGLDNLKNFQRKGAIAEAKAQFRAVLTEDPENAAATAGYSLALVNEYIDEESDPTILEAALSAARLAVSLDNQLALAHISLAWALEYDGKMQQANESYQRALKLDPTQNLVLQGYGRFLTIQGDYEKAVSIYKRAIEIHPEEGAFYIDLGDNYLKLGQYDNAETELLKALELSPDNISAYLTLSAVLYSKSDVLGAIQVAQQGIQIRPHSRLYGNLGTFYFTMGQYAQAVYAFERAIDVTGNSHSYLQWANLADAYRMIPETYEKSKATYKRALQLLKERMSPTEVRPKYISRAALYHAKAGELDEAQSMAHEAISLAPKDSSVLFRAAVTYDLAGQRDKALALIKKALDQGYPLAAIKSEPDLADLRNHPLYHQLLTDQDDS